MILLISNDIEKRGRIDRINIQNHHKLGKVAEIYRTESTGNNFKAVSLSRKSSH